MGIIEQYEMELWAMQREADHPLTDDTTRQLLERSIVRMHQRLDDLYEGDLV